jgi:tetratricopeptide (TPR) repeat protein
VKIKLLWLIFALVAFHDVKGQPAVKDSLKNLLKLKISTPVKVDVLNLLAYQYYDYNDSIASNYAQTAVNLAKEIGYLKGLKYAYTMVGLGFSSNSKFKEAIRYFLISDKIKGQPNDATAAYNLALLGNCYRDMGKYDSAFITYNKAIKNNYKSWEIYSAIYKNMAIVNLILWRNKEAIVLADSALKYLNRDKIPISMCVWTYGVSTVKHTKISFNLIAPKSIMTACVPPPLTSKIITTKLCVS